MKNSPSLKTKPETPKTPGGISKSLLTPCRRVGLSRNWRKSVASPFNSPLASSEIKQDVGEARKRKESLEETPKGSESENTGTPSRKVELPRRKKSKLLINPITTPDDDCPQPEPSKNIECEKNESDNEKKNKTKLNTCTPQSKCKENTSEIIPRNYSVVPNIVSTPVRLKSKSKSDKISPKSTIKKKETEGTKVVDAINIERENVKCHEQIEMEAIAIKQDLSKKDDSKNTEKVISPNKLTKECIVVIQNKLFKNQLNEKKNIEIDDTKQTSQTLFNDSDSDDVPLNCLNKSDKCETIAIGDDDDFTNKPKLKKSNSTKTKAKVAKQKDSKECTIPIQIYPSQNSIDDDDEFFQKKKTILIRKSYEKVIKPSKAKSTGSITQKDIEDLKARIETKKKMLLAQSMTDTKELRELIKKWQKGCQDALMELMDLMKNKCPEQNMQYPHILQTLKIPADLVGYDSENDCFITPEDKNIILSYIKE